jgi:hypothetical protein
MFSCLGPLVIYEIAGGAYASRDGDRRDGANTRLLLYKAR